MATKTTNFNEMRPVIITAHKSGNRKAITRDMVQGAEIDIRFLNEWIRDVNELRATVKEYVKRKFALKYGYLLDGKEVTEDDLFASKELIFPKWKEVLQVGEESKDYKELHVDVQDVDDLISFACDYMDTGKGSCECVVTEQIFRKKVETLLGCAIAKNEILDDTDRDTLSDFRSAQNRVQKAIDKKAELETSKKSFDIILKGLPDTEKGFKKYLENKIAEIDAELKKNEVSKAEADADVKKFSHDAKAILNRIRYAK